jgi:hypothetical protein
MRLLALLVLIIFCTSSCEKGNVEIVKHVYNATLKVTVYTQHINAGGQISDIPLTGATVELFETKYDRENNQNMVSSHNTDINGLAQFFNLLVGYYYIRATHPSYGQVLDETSTPDGSVSFVEIIF